MIVGSICLPCPPRSLVEPRLRLQAAGSERDTPPAERGSVGGGRGGERGWIPAPSCPGIRRGSGWSTPISWKPDWRYSTGFLQREDEPGLWNSCPRPPRCQRTRPAGARLSGGAPGRRRGWLLQEAPDTTRSGRPPSSSRHLHAEGALSTLSVNTTTHRQILGRIERPPAMPRPVKERASSWLVLHARPHSVLHVRGIKHFRSEIPRGVRLQDVGQERCKFLAISRPIFPGSGGTEGGVCPQLIQGLICVSPPPRSAADQPHAGATYPETVSEHLCRGERRQTDTSCQSTRGAHWTDTSLLKRYVYTGRVGVN